MEEDNITLLTDQYNTFQEEIEKFNEKGVAAAGTRARKALLEKLLEKKFKIRRMQVKHK
jgi:hypothetical protein